MACNGGCKGSHNHRENLIQRLRAQLPREQLLEENRHARMADLERAVSMHPVFWPINCENQTQILSTGVKIIGKTDKAVWPVIVHGAISTLGLFRDLGAGDQAADTPLAFRLQVNDTGQTERTWASEPVPESLLTGQARRWEGADTVTDHFETQPFAAPVLVESGNRLVLNMQNDGAQTGYTRGYFNFLGTHVYEYAANQGKLDAQTRQRAERYIREYPYQRFVIIALTIDFTTDTKNLQFNTYYDDLLVLGFASDLWYSTIEMKDPYGVEWTSNPTQIQAVCSYSPALPEISRFRMLVEPQFLPKATSPTLNVQKQVDVGAAGPPTQVTEDGTTIWMLAKTL